MNNFKVVILSKNANNVQSCVQSICNCEPVLPRENIIIVDDGAETGAASKFPLLAWQLTWLSGEKPFVFARNANIGIERAFESGADAVILMNDDATLATAGGFTKLARDSSGYGLIAPSVIGVVGNDNQLHRRWDEDKIRLETSNLCFVCVLIPRVVWNQVGKLDERFVQYGYEDTDYSRRVLGLNVPLGIHNGVVVQHGYRPSSFRNANPQLDNMVCHNRRLFNEKWGIRE